MKMIDFEKHKQLTITEVDELEKLVRFHRVRCNDASALKKAFYTELRGEKHYRYLTIEKLIKEQTGKEVRFMDWLMDQFYSLNMNGEPLSFPTKHIDKYIEYLKELYAD